MNRIINGFQRETLCQLIVMFVPDGSFLQCAKTRLLYAYVTRTVESSSFEPQVNFEYNIFQLRRF